MQVQTPVPWLSEVLAVMEEIVEVCQEISDKVSDPWVHLYITYCVLHLFVYFRSEDLIFPNYQNQQLCR